MAVEHFTPDIDGDENLVQIAALTPTDNAVIIGNGSAWTAESGSTLRTSLGLGIGTDVMAYDADLADWAGVNPSSYLTTAAAAAAYQPLDADLTAWAGVNPSSYLTTSAAAAAYQPLDSDLTSWAAITRASGFDTFAATPTSANLRTLLSDESGSGALLFAGGDLGTPASGVLTNCTGLPNASVVGLGTAALVADNTLVHLAGVETLIARKHFGAGLVIAGDAGANPGAISAGANYGMVFTPFTNSPGIADFAWLNRAQNVVQMSLNGSVLSVGSDPVMTRGATETVTGVKTISAKTLFTNSTAGLALRNDTASLYFENTAGTRSGYLSAPSSGAWVLENEIGSGTLSVRMPGGTTFGSPTGGAKGSGTINAIAVYDDNTLLTCYIVEAWKYGQIDLGKWDALAPNREYPAQFETIETGEKDAEDKPVTEQRLVKEAYTEVREHTPARGFAKVAADRLDIDKFAQFVWDNERLPAFPAPDRWADLYAGKMATGDLIQRLWETVEVMAVHSIEARKREVVLTARLAALEASQ